MKEGRTIEELAAEVQRQHQEKKDYRGPAQRLAMLDSGLLSIGEIVTCGVTELAHRQICQHLKIPKKYYDTMQAQAPELLAANVNHWWGKTDPEKDHRTIRTLDGDVRAYLSGTYRALDNYEMLAALIPVLRDMAVTIMSCQVTGKRMYIKVVTDKIQAQIKVGDVVQAGMVISNSEVGLGSLRVEPLIYRLICANGMITSQRYRKYHVKRDRTFNDGSQFFTDKTQEVTDESFWRRMQDTVRGSFRQDVFDGEFRKWVDSTEVKIEADPVKFVDNVAKEFELIEPEKNLVLTNLLQEGDMSKYGLMNAVTAMSKKVENYDRATDMERLGGEIIELTPREWDGLNTIKEDKKKKGK